MLVVKRETEHDLALAAADLFVDDCLRVLDEDRECTVAVSGGRTPSGFFRLLAKEKRLAQEAWSRIHFFWVDERCVPENDPASNYGNTKRVLLDCVPILPDHVHPMACGPEPEQSAIRYEEQLWKFFKLSPGSFPRLDLIVLGVGSDGHTASLFPGTDSLLEKRRCVVPVKGGDPDVWRLTLTFPVLNAAANLIILAAGKEKARVVRALMGLSNEDFPVQRVRPEKGTITLILDRQAAGESDSRVREAQDRRGNSRILKGLQLPVP